MFVALLMVGCGGDDSGSDSPESNQSSAENPPAAKTAEVEQIDLDDNETLAKIIAEAIDDSSLELGGKEGEELNYLKLHSEGVITVEEVMGQKLFSGASKRMYENGQIMFLNQYKDGKQDGLHFFWSEKGQKVVEANFKDGKLDGLWTAWHENGKKATEGNFKDDKEHGLWVFYNEDGTEKERKTFNVVTRFLKQVIFREDSKKGNW